LVHEIEALAHQSLAAYRKLGNPAGEIGALGMLSYIFYTQREGNYAVGIRYCEQALEIASGSGGWDAERLIVGNLGNLWQFEGKYARAKDYLEQQFQICAQAQHRNFIACAYLELGWLALMQGDYALAQSQLTEALRIYQETGNQQQYRVKVLGLLALLHHAQGDHAQASRYGADAVNFARQLHDPRVEGDALTRWGRVLVSQDKLVEAAELFQQALVYFRQTEQWNHTMMPLAGLAEIALRQGDSVQAQAWLDPVLTHLQTHQLDRTDEELYVYMTCYRVLRALQDQRFIDLLRLAYEQLQVRAASLETAYEQQMFWSAPPHAAVLAAVEKSAGLMRTI
jgi:tetratricopeptide (TPR) repeat protein